MVRIVLFTTFGTLLSALSWPPDRFAASGAIILSTGVAGRDPVEVGVGLGAGGGE
jgi:hypothetical protein